jgi:4,5-DOPA dioxygenase extradiol
MEPLGRRAFLEATVVAACALGAGAAAAAGSAKKGAAPMSASHPRSTGERRPARMPALFVGHGNPMNALEDGVWSRRFRDLGRSLPRPRAIVAVSAHWYVNGTFTTGNAQPETIHDFGGFPEDLYRIQYPAPGDPALARRVVELVGESRAAVSEDWGLDHGTWSVLVHLRPVADVPVVQLSVDARLAPAEHLAIGRALAPLRDEGVLVLGSGNAVHNLRHAFGAMQRGDTRTPDWARAFDLGIARALERHDTDHLVRALASDEGRLSHPTPEHYLPLLYAAGASTHDEPVRFAIEGFDMASLSMRAAVLG